MSDETRRIVGTVVWVVAVIAIALGAAGLVTATPSAVLPAARPELTGAVDAAVDGHLDVVETELEALAQHVDTLGTQARGALSALVAAKTDTAETAIATGGTLLDDIVVETAALRAELAAIPWVGTASADLHVSPAVQERYARLKAGIAVTDGLDAAWARLTSGAVTATRVSTSLAEHDRLVGLAAARGRAARYADALGYLDDAAAELKKASALRTQLANTVDVSVLDEWLDRNTAYDKALRELYVQLAKVKGKVTADVRNAIASEKEARKRLPPDSRGLILIIAEIGRGGMNGAVIAIEEAKARLTDALEPPPSPSPSAEPTTTP